MSVGEKISILFSDFWQTYDAAVLIIGGIILFLPWLIANISISGFVYENLIDMNFAFDSDLFFLIVGWIIIAIAWLWLPALVYFVIL